MKAKKIYESFDDVLKPKSPLELEAIIPPNMRDLVEEAYETILHNKKFVITSDLGYYDSMYGFQFEEIEPLNIGSKYHDGEIAEYTFGYFPEDEVCIIIFDNNGHDSTITTIEDLYDYLHIDEDDFEQPQGMFEGSLDSVLKPKSDDELRVQFEKNHPEFVQIVKELFPGHDYPLEREEESVESSIMFNVPSEDGKNHSFMLSTNKHYVYPNIFYLDHTIRDEKISGMFKDQKIVKTSKDVESYVNRHINP